MLLNFAHELHKLTADFREVKRKNSQKFIFYKHHFAKANGLNYSSFIDLNMGTYRKGSMSLFQVIAVVLMCRVTLACAAVPDELDGLAGKILQASSENLQEKYPSGAMKASDSVSFVQPVEDEVVRNFFLLCRANIRRIKCFSMLIFERMMQIKNKINGGFITCRH